ncbi:MAG: hypothetical protein A3B70_04455 [Deltaproteobacteria bacterium RIFCSPHIGHO2_02_FULL_40_11]|nr:MAG: hypothetical protein A3B70_04455 [Deltaproteobacteria bacterium RIFCSPHIGHO2_02_FULL_40_11]
MKTLNYVILGGILLLSHIAFGQGQINVQNGNINHYYQDFLVPGHGFALKVERSFNSKSGYLGMFGHKWGSNFDIDFEVTPEGTVEITEFGGGFKTTFTPQKYTKANIEKFVNDLWEKIPGTSKTPELKKSLLTDAKLRHKVATERKFVQEIAVGTPLFANDRGPEELKKAKTKAGEILWTRSFADGRQEIFNAKGLLVKMQDPNKNFVRLEYNAKNQLVKVVDTTGRRIALEYNTQGLVSEITSPLGQKCLYKYTKAKDLEYAKNAKGYEFHHKYNNKHHMTEVLYPTGQKEAMNYDAEDRIISHQGPEDILTTYRYDTKGKPEQFFDVVVSKEIGKKPNMVTTVDKYSYEFGTRNNGSQFTKKIVTVLDGVKTDTEYSECCGKPLSINREGKITRFEYLDNGLLKKKVSPSGEMVVLTYENKFNKVSKVTRTMPQQKKPDVTDYKYDAKGNLAFAKNDVRKISVQLFYDTKGRIRKLVDQSGKKIAFEYNELGKPTKITQEGIGSIMVSYNAAGVITNVKSTAGRKIAVEVTSAFQSLLDVIRPAGVSLNI